MDCDKLRDEGGGMEAADRLDADVALGVDVLHHHPDLIRVGGEKNAQRLLQFGWERRALDPDHVSQAIVARFIARPPQDLGRDVLDLIFEPRQSRGIAYSPKQ